jgi:hypothetical protein
VFAVLWSRGRAVQGGFVQVLPKPVTRSRSAEGETEKRSEVRQFPSGQSLSIESMQVGSGHGHLVRSRFWCTFSHAYALDES